MKLLQIITKHTRPNNFIRLGPHFRNSSSLPTISDVKTDIKESQKPTKKPFVKNLFLGRFDVDILYYPEVLLKDRLDALESKAVEIENIFATDQSSREKLKESKALGLFGLQAPEEYGGLNLNATEMTRFCEVLSQDGPAAIAVMSHQSYGLKGLLQEGNQDQKKKYLSLLTSGEWVAAFCLAEPQVSKDPLGVDTEALFLDGKWIINGSKVIISSDGNADLMTVIARTSKDAFGGKKIPSLTAFLVERTYDGVTFGDPVDIVDDRGVCINEVTFKNTPVPLENVLGEDGNGYKLCADIMNSNRFCAGSYSARILKSLLQKVVNHTLNQKQFGKNFMDFELMQKKITDIVFSIYTLDSMSYLTAGILDSYENPDAILESAIVKVFSSEVLRDSIQECQNLVGLEFFKDKTYDTILRESKVFMHLEGSNEVLRMFIALGGLQHAGNEMKDDINKARNPAFNPTFIFKKIIEKRNQINDKPKLTLGLDGHVHPSLANAAQQLEYGVLRLQFAVEMLLTQHGRNIVEKEIDLNRLTDIVIGLYAMTAVLARASRSYCTGIRDSEYEMKIAGFICNNIVETIKTRIRDMQNNVQDKIYLDVAKKVNGYRGYFLEHPLTRNIH